MLKEIKEECSLRNIDITKSAINMDYWYVSQSLTQELYKLGFTKIIVVGKGNYVFEGEYFKGKASE